MAHRAQVDFFQVFGSMLAKAKWWWWVMAFLAVIPRVFVCAGVKKSKLNERSRLVSHLEEGDLETI
jgi:hypothetical protein